MNTSWPAKKLGEITIVIMGQSPPGSTYNTKGEGLPFFQGKAEFGSESPTPVKWCSAPKRIAEAGDILLSVRAPVGPTNFAIERCCIGRGLAAIRAKEGVVSSCYLRYFLRFFETDLARQGVGSTFTAINRNDVEGLTLSLPCITEQDRIVRILDEAEELRKLRTEADRRTADLIPSIFREMFGDPASNPKGWPAGTIADFAVFITSGSRGWAKYYSQNGAKFIRVQNLTENRFNLDDIAYVKPPNTAETRRTKIKSGDVLLTITGVVGLSTVASEPLSDAFVSQHVAIVRVDDKINPEFLASFIADKAGGQKQIIEMQYGQTRPGLNLQQIRAIQVFLPPLSLQNTFSTRISEVRQLEAKQAESRRRIDDLFQSFLHRAFRGEL